MSPIQRSLPVSTGRPQNLPKCANATASGELHVGVRLPSWGKAGILVVLVVAVYATTFRAGFVYDDFLLLVDNPFVAARDGLSRIWTSTRQPDYFPLTVTSFWLEWRLWGHRPAGYHGTNVTLHLGGALLLWRLLLRLRVPGAWLAALLFAVHPVSVASVAWISERKNTLSLLFFALAFNLFVDSEEGRHGRFLYWSAFVAFVLGLLAKTSGVTLPLVMVAAVAWRRGGWNRADVIRAVPFLAASGILGAATIWFQHHRAMNGTTMALPLLDRIGNAAGALWLYACKALVPLQVGVVYDPWTGPRAGLLRSLAVVGVVTVAAAVWAARRRLGAGLLLAAGAYILLLVPVLGFIEMALIRHTPIADHWQYLALPAAMAAVAAGLTRCAEKARGVLGRATVGGTVVLIACLCARSAARATVYSDDESLWRHAVAVAPGSAYAHANLGNELFQRGRREEARPFLLRAIRLDPRHATALHQLASIALEQQNVEVAVDRLERALEAEPAYVEARLLLVCLLVPVAPTEAAAHAEYLLRQSHRVAFGLGATLGRQKRTAEAIVLLERLTHSPSSTAAHLALGAALATTGELDRAERAFRHVLARASDDADALFGLGAVADGRGDRAKALSLYERALASTSDHPEAAARLRRLGAR